jgi:hypothetical protein
MVCFSNSEKCFGFFQLIYVSANLFWFFLSAGYWTKNVKIKKIIHQRQKMASLLAIPAVMAVSNMLDTVADTMAEATASVHQKCVDLKRKLTPRKNAEVPKKHEYSQEYHNIVNKHQKN